MKLLLISGFILIFCISLSADILNVPNTYSTIQAGIDAASSGDTVLVEQGTYPETINFSGKNIVVASLYLTNPDTSIISATIIDGGFSGSVVKFENGEDSTAVLQGFTITNGYSIGGGGGIMCNSTSSPTLKNLAITSNIGGVGGGIFCFGSAKPQLYDVIIENNSAINSGGGIYCENNAEIRLEHVTVSENVSNQNGGAIYLKSGTVANLHNVTIDGNTSVSFGAGLYCATNSTLHLENSLITGNESDQDGGGIYVSDSCIVTLIQDTLIGNKGAFGGGLYCDLNSDLSVSLCSFEDNIAEFWGGGIYLYETEATIQSSSLHENSAADGGGIFCDINATVNFNDGIISDNHAENWGGGVYCDDANTIFSGTRIINNTALLGGGIFAGWNESLTLNDVTISGNKATTNGGGISLLESSLDVENVNIYHNQALQSGGGIHFDISNINFSAENLSNIHLNFAGFFGNDLYASNSELITVFVDTFTVENPTEYQAFPYDNFAYNVQNGKVEQVEADVYVNPEGNDSNSGLSEQEALKTIAIALTKILADSLNPHSIYLAGGEYSPSMNAQIFPLNMTKYVSLVGDSSLNLPNGEGNSSLLNAENGSNIAIFNQDPGITLKYISMTGGSAEYGGGIFCRESSPQLFRLTVYGNSATYGGGLYASLNSQPSFLNTTISENSVDEGGAIYCSGSNPILINSILWENTPEEIVFDPSTDTSYIVIAYSDIQDSLNGIITNNNGSVEWLAGNINDDPMFSNPGEGNFKINDESSPVVDTGIHDQYLYYNQGRDSLFIPEISIRGEMPDMGAYEFPVVDGIADRKGLIKSFALFQNYPNPFNPITTIKFNLPVQENVKIEIFNLLGQQVMTLVDKNFQAGQHKIEFNGQHIASGIYFYRIEAGQYNSVKKMTILK
jgi:predicted outer membrane repeat protein